MESKGENSLFSIVCYYKGTYTTSSGRTSSFYFTYLVDEESGKYRNHGEGVFDGDTWYVMFDFDNLFVAY